MSMQEPFNSFLHSPQVQRWSHEFVRNVNVAALIVSVVLIGMSLFTALKAPKAHIVLSVIPQQKEIVTGEVVKVDIVAGIQGGALQAFVGVIEFDDTRLGLSCTDYRNCVDIVVREPFTAVHDLRQEGNKIYLSAKSDTPITGSSVVLATVSFHVKHSALFGDAYITIDHTQAQAAVNTKKSGTPTYRIQNSLLAVVSPYASDGVVLGVNDPFVISNVDSNEQVFSAVVSWSTSAEASDSVISGLSPANQLGQTTFSDSNLTYSHSIKLSALQPNTTYTFTVSSHVPNGRNDSVSGVQFTTRPADLSLDANIILEARRDRVCDNWIECSASVETKNVRGESINLCFDYGVCDTYDPIAKKCVNFVRPSPNAQEFIIAKSAPEVSTIEDARYVSGYSRAGARWIGATGGDEFINTTIEGYTPYSRMQERGSSLTVPNGNFETGAAFPWEPRFYSSTGLREEMASIENLPDRSDLRQDLNRVLVVTPVKRQNETVSGVRVPLGLTVRDTVQYYVSMNVKTDDRSIDELIVQFGFHNYSGPYPAYATERVPVSNGWQQVIIGPLEARASDLPNPGEQTYLGVLAQTDQSLPPYQPFYLDNVQIHPVLEAAPNTRITASCRAYSSDTAPSCRYYDASSGIEYQGWDGYCIEPDPRNPRRCIQWKPIDFVAGAQSTITSFARAGYGSDSKIERFPLYYCTEAAGKAPYARHMLYGGSSARANQDRDVEWYMTGSQIIIEQAENNPYPGMPLSILREGIDVYRNEIIELRVTGIQIDSDGDTDYDCPRVLVSGSPHISSGNTATLVFNENNKSDWDAGFNFTRTCSGKPKVVNGGAYAYCDGKGSGNECNMLSAYMVFDEYDRLEQIRLRYTEQEGNGYVKFDSIELTYRGGRCEVLSMTVDPLGNNTAFSRRVSSPTYAVPGIGYQKNQDYAPFGAMVVPPPDFDPTAWDGDNNSPGKQPLYTEPFDNQEEPLAPYQARSGSPYGISRALQQNRCLEGTKAGKLCTTPSECDYIGPPGLCGFWNGGTSRTCFGGANDGLACSFPSECPGGDIPGKCGVDPTVVYLDRGMCIEGRSIGGKCDTHNQCGSGLGSCAGVVPPQNTQNEPQFLSALNSPTITGAERLSSLFAKSYGIWKWDVFQNRYRPVCTAPGECRDYICSGGTQPGRGCDPNNTDPAQCPGGGSCIQDTSRTYGWDITKDLIVQNNVCTTGKVGRICTVDDDCDVLGPGFCDPVENRQTGEVTFECSSGPYIGQACDPANGDRDCANVAQEGQCGGGAGSDEFEPPYISNLTIKGPRNEAVNNENVPLYVPRGQGAVSLSFNSHVSVNQIPLTRYTVEWNDGHITEESSLKIAPKTQDPHLVAHTYYCEDLNNDGQVNSSDYPNNWNASLQACVYKPRVEIEDHWGWCSGNVTRGNIPITNGTENFSGNGAACNSWDIFNGQVVVCPLSSGPTVCD